ncbi:MAG: hypothetical protein ACOZNI_33775 [Myxococcota bacterium]
MWVWLLACATEEEPADGLVLLEPRAQLIRLSVDLRGVHPSEDELAAIEASPALYEQFVDRYLADPRFLGRVREIFNLRFLTRDGETYFDPGDAGLDADAGELADDVGDEVLRLVTYAVENDLPYSYVVTAEHTMATPLLAAFWGLDYPDGATGWQPATWRDARPAAGVLSMTGIWQRYPSMGGNANRHRANAISKMLLCDDYLSRPIVLDRAAVDLLTEDPENAISTTSSCQSCHSTLDPLAGNLFGFFHYDDDMSMEDAVTYRPENEEAWRDYSGKEPAYYGRPTANLRELAWEIAEDPRFATCAARTVWEGLHQREYEDADWADLQAHRDVFEDGDLRIPPLVRSIVTSRAYLAGEDEAGRVATARIVSPAQLADVVEGVTGYRWTFGGRDGLTTHDLGLPVLAGGVDAAYVTTPAYTPSLGLVYVQERLAQAAARHVAEHDLAEGRTDDAILLKYVTSASTPDDATFEPQVRHLYLAITGYPLADDAEEPALLATLWREVWSVEASPTAAWAAVVTAVLRDPRVILY